MNDADTAPREPVVPRDVSEPGIIKELTGTGPDVFTKPWNALHDLIPTIPFWVAGGAITSLFNSEPINDWDIFSPEPYKAIIEIISNGAKMTFENSHIANFTHESICEKIQIIKRSFESIEHTVSEIDLTICAAGYNGQSLFVHEDFTDDVDNMTIGLNQVKHPLSTLRRVVKYSRRGYDLHPDVLVTLADQIRHSTNDELTNFSFYLDNEFS